jgi:hypothetical protein
MVAIIRFLPLRFGCTMLTIPIKMSGCMMTEPCGAASVVSLVCDRHTSESEIMHNI